MLVQLGERGVAQRRKAAMVKPVHNSKILDISRKG